LSLFVTFFITRLREDDAIGSLYINAVGTIFFMFTVVSENGDKLNRLI